MAGSRKRKKIRWKGWKGGLALAGVLVFIGAFVFYFMNTYIETEREYTVYSALEEATLPVVFAVAEGYDINPMFGCLQDMGSAAAADCVTPLPEDRALELKIKMYGNRAAGISYEIRSLDTGHFIEKTTIESFSEDENGNTYIKLPIQNLIKADTQYLLRLKIELGEQTVNYYTKIILPGSDDVYSMIRTASEFTEKSFDYDEARELAVYLETDEWADDSSLGTVSINSSFSQITWANTGMSLVSNPVVALREYDGIMSAVEVSYKTESTDISGNTDTYINTDNFTLRAGSERVYMMNFERKTEQVFNGSKHAFSGKRINLGISNEESLQAVKSPDGRFIAFKSGRELWLYDQEGLSAVNVFTFRSETDSIRSDHADHDIKIMSLTDDGELEFAVYGYMNRGRHEGYNGITYFRYNHENSLLSEIFFMPVAMGYEKLKLELDELLIKSGIGMVYLKLNEAVTAVDLTALEVMDVVSGLTGGRYAVSYDQSRMAWIDGESYQPNSIKVMDMMTGTTQTIGGSAGEVLSVVGFYNQDLIYGISTGIDLLRINGRIEALPLHMLKIVGPDLSNILDYERDGLYFDNIEVEEDRIHIGQYRKNLDTGRYEFQGRDTIVCSEQEENVYLECILSEYNSVKKRIYYINLDENIRTTRLLDVCAPENISYENSGTIDMAAAKKDSPIRYYAYANGALKGMAYSIGDAIDLIYDDMGWIRDDNSAVIYARADRTGTCTVKEPMSAAAPLTAAIEDGFTADYITDSGYIIMDAYGAALNRLLYYVYKGCPVVAYLNGGEYCLIYGYTADTVELYYPAGNAGGGEDNVDNAATDEGTGGEAPEEGLSTTAVMQLEEAALYFDRYQNDFIVFLEYPGMQ